MKKVEGIIISEERHNELLEKEKKADSNVISLMLPVTISERIYYEHSVYDRVQVKVDDLTLVGEFPDKENVVEYIKGHLKSILCRLEEKDKEADWQYKKRIEEEARVRELEKNVISQAKSLVHYNSIKDKWWFKLFAKNDSKNTPI